MISLLIPTRNRPEWVERMWRSAVATAEGEVEFCFYFDDDDLTSEVVWGAFKANGAATKGERLVLSEAWNRAYELASGEILMHASDDIVFRTPGWDRFITETFDRFPDRLVFVYGSDGYQDERLGTHGFLSREWVETVGYFVPPYFSSDFNDLWLHEVAGMIGRRVYVPEVFIEHMHPDAGKAQWDQTHLERKERHRRDRPDLLYRSLASEREADAEKLRARMLAVVA